MTDEYVAVRIVKPWQFYSVGAVITPPAGRADYLVRAGVAVYEKATTPELEVATAEAPVETADARPRRKRR